MALSAATIGPYQLLDRYAVGGSAEIYRAHDTRNGDLVVIKRLRPDVDHPATVTQGFLREVNLASQMNHKNLIHGRDRGVHHGQHYVVLEFVDGPDLRRLLSRARERNVKIPLEFALFMAREVLDGLEYSHNLVTPQGVAMGLVHRDICPRNVFVSYDGSIRVADFGCSVFTHLEKPPTAVVGSLGYLSPEQASLLPLDRRSDVFAVGCILHELVVGSPALDRENKSDAAVLKAHKKCRLRPVPPDVPDNVRLILEMACSADRAFRYPTAGAMRDAVDGILQEKAYTTSLAIAALTRHLFREEFKATRLPGSPLTF